MELRWYQRDAVDAAWSHIRNNRAGCNPVVVAPTGSGKSLMIATMAEEAIQRFDGRVLILAHRKELLEQNADKIQRLASSVEVGLYSAGLNRRETDSPVIVAGIQSVFKRAEEFGKRNLIIIDEAHLVPRDGEGMYRTFLEGVAGVNPKIRVVGLTATPYRLDSGPLCTPDGLFNKVCYNVDIKRLIDEGWLTTLTTSAADGTVDTSNINVRGGEFVASDMQFAFGEDAVVCAAVNEIVQKTQDRKSVLIFCAGVAHAEHVANLLSSATGEDTGLVTGETLPLVRMETLRRFGNRELRFLVNCDVLTTGFDAPCIDCIAILRATQSAGLFAQICGRGFRIFEGKDNCLILDFGENLKRHGPLDSPSYGRCRRTGGVVGETPMKNCPNCGETLLANALKCFCGFVFPGPQTRHNETADGESQLFAEPQTFDVQDVSYQYHTKRNAQPDDKPSMRVNYVCNSGSGLSTEVISEWICLEHAGYAGDKAANWWAERSNAPLPDTIDDAVEVAQIGGLAWPTKIVAKKDGRFWRVESAELEEKPCWDAGAFEPGGLDADTREFLESWGDVLEIPF